MQANAYQEAVLGFVRAGGEHGVVEATAGSGKTTTLVMVARTLVEELRVPPSEVAFLAFNRSAAAELARRLPEGVVALTLHALGLRVVSSAGVGGHLSEGKYERLAAAIPGLPPQAPAMLAELARFARLELTELRSALQVEALAARYRVELPLPAARALPLVVEFLRAGVASPEVDFTDLLYLPVRLGLRVPRYAFVCVDEAQDLSRLALAFVERLVAAGARALFVGDPHQAIYAFAGADSRSLPRIARLTRARTMPLSVSFRCPTRHVVLARRFSPAMLPAPGAATGTVRVTQLARLPSEAEPGDLVLSRTNGPLLDVALAVAAAGTPVVVLGDDLLPAASSLAERLSTSADLGRESLAASLESERRRLEAEHLTDLALPRLLEASRQSHVAVALAAAAAGTSRPAPVMESLRRLFPESAVAADAPHLLLSTIHKAKGREAPRVFLLAPEELGVGAGPEQAAMHGDPSSRTGSEGEADRVGGPPDEDASEANVLFVALTRAKRELVLVEGSQGAVAKRLRGHAQAGGAAGLTRSWDDVLRLALRMSEGLSSPGISSRHGQARGVQDAGRQAGGGRRGGGGRQDRLGRGERRLLPRARDGPPGPDGSARGRPS